MPIFHKYNESKTSDLMNLYYFLNLKVYFAVRFEIGDTGYEIGDTRFVKNDAKT